MLTKWAVLLCLLWYLFLSLSLSVKSRRRHCVHTYSLLEQFMILWGTSHDDHMLVTWRILLIPLVFIVCLRCLSCLLPVSTVSLVVWSSRRSYWWVTWLVCGRHLTVMWLGITGRTHTVRGHASRETNQTTEPGFTTLWESKCYSVLPLSPSLLLPPFLFSSFKEIILFSLSLFFQIGMVADHHEELLKVKQGPGWSELSITWPTVTWLLVVIVIGGGGLTSQSTKAGYGSTSCHWSCDHHVTVCLLNRSEEASLLIGSGGTLVNYKLSQAEWLWGHFVDRIWYLTEREFAKG